MNAGDFVMQVFQRLWPVLPITLVAMAGVVVSLLYLKKARRPATFALLGFGLLLLGKACDPITSTLVYNSARSNYRSIAAVLGFYQLGFSTLNALALVLLMIAVFCGRKAAE